MRKNIFFLIFILFRYSISAQGVEELIEDLYNDDVFITIPATDEIIIKNINEGYDPIDELYESKPPIVQAKFLDALLVFQDPQLHHRLIDYINRADNFSNEEYPLDPLTEKVHATYLLFKLEEYDTYSYVFDLIDRDGIVNLNLYAFRALKEIIENVVEAEVQAKNILIDIWNSSSDDYLRYFSMIYLIEAYGDEMLNHTISTFQSDSDLASRKLALSYLFQFEYSGLNSLLKTQLIEESAWVFRVDIADSLVKKYGEPSDLKAAIDYQPNEPDETAKSLMNFSIVEFIPPKPETLTWNELTTRLIDYTDEMYGYGWIADEQTRDYYEHHLKEVISFMNTSQLAQACQTISLYILGMVENHLNEELVTIEAYKFLHYYTVYIKEEIEENYGACLY